MLSAEIIELWPVNATTNPDGRLAQIDREIEGFRETAIKIEEQMDYYTLALEALRGNAQYVVDAYRSALNERDRVLALIMRRQG